MAKLAPPLASLPLRETVSSVLPRPSPSNVTRPLHETLGVAREVLPAAPPAAALGGEPAVALSGEPGARPTRSPATLPRRTSVVVGAGGFCGGRGGVAASAPAGRPALPWAASSMSKWLRCSVAAAMHSGEEKGQSRGAAEPGVDLSENDVGGRLHGSSDGSLRL